MELYYRYNSMEEKAMLEATVTFQLLRDESIGSKRFLVYDDLVEMPFTIPDDVIKEGFIEMLSLLNEAREVANLAEVTPAEFLAGIKVRLGI